MNAPLPPTEIERFLASHPAGPRLKLAGGSADSRGVQPTPRPFLYSIATLFLAAAIASALPWELARSALALVCILLVLPVSILLYAGYVRDVHAAGPELAPGAFASLLMRAPVMGLGLVSLAIGGAIIAWVLYNAFIERQAAYTLPVWFTSLGIGPLLVAFGWSLLRRPTA